MLNFEEEKPPYEHIEELLYMGKKMPCMHHHEDSGCPHLQVT